MNDQIRDHLSFIYGVDNAKPLAQRIAELVAQYRTELSPIRGDTDRFSQRDAILITYGDMVQDTGETPLRTLGRFLQAHCRGMLNGVHILPFYPYTSDDGFSVVDYRIVDPALGSWADVTKLGRHFSLMFDAVINHISAQSEWFQRFLQDDPRFRDYFITVPPGTDLSDVFRPRALPLLTPVQTPSGEKLVWTTFSADQVDLNFAYPAVMLEIVDLLLFYVANGARYLRLDAIAYMWKEIGTSSIHRPETHRLIQLFRAVLDRVAPETILITETNVPHKDNIAYFGDGANEAQMVYNFTLPPLTLHAFHTGRATILNEWAASLSLPSDRVTFFNFLASHDGIGVTPARGWLSDTEVATIAERVLALGGQVSYKNNPDGSQSAYELNINFLDALGNPDRPDEPIALVARRFLAAQAIMLALRGVPGIYFHSLFGSRGWPEGVAETGRARTINRQKLHRQELEAELNTAGSLRQRVFQGMTRLLAIRSTSAAFHPLAGQEILHLHPAVFVVERREPAGSETVLCLHNVSAAEVMVSLPTGRFTDLLSDQGYQSTAQLAPYQVMWLREEA